MEASHWNQSLLCLLSSSNSIAGVSLWWLKMAALPDKLSLPVTSLSWQSVWTGHPDHSWPCVRARERERERARERLPVRQDCIRRELFVSLPWSWDVLTSTSGRNEFDSLRASLLGLNCWTWKETLTGFLVRYYVYVSYVFSASWICGK